MRIKSIICISALAMLLVPETYADGYQDAGTVFGIKIGEKISHSFKRVDYNGSKNVYSFKPAYADAFFDKYYVAVTPNSKRIYCVIASAHYTASKSPSELQALHSNAIRLFGNEYKVQYVQGALDDHYWSFASPTKKNYRNVTGCVRPGCYELIIYDEAGWRVALKEGDDNESRMSGFGKYELYCAKTRSDIENAANCEHAKTLKWEQERAAEQDKMARQKLAAEKGSVVPKGGAGLTSWIGIRFGEKVDTAKLSPPSSGKGNGIRFSFTPERKFREFGEYEIGITPITKMVASVNCSQDFESNSAAHNEYLEVVKIIWQKFSHEPGIVRSDSDEKAKWRFTKENYGYNRTVSVCYYASIPGKFPASVLIEVVDKTVGEAIEAEKKSRGSLDADVL